jgi:hypothetical protein
MTFKNKIQHFKKMLTKVRIENEEEMELNKRSTRIKK